MKKDLLCLIEQIDDIKKLGHKKDGYVPFDFVLYDVDEFIDWKQKIKCELMNIPNQNQYIIETLKIVDARYNGRTDKGLFQELTGALKAIKNNIDQYYNEENNDVNFSTNKVFIVHGHDEVVRDKVELFLRRVGLEPIILCNQPNSGLTIIEKIEEYSDVAFALVLYTGCDQGKLKTDNVLKLRARQNVVFEHGYLIHKLGRKKVVALVENDVETPGDVAGVLYISLSNGDWKQQVLRELKNCGLHIDVTKA